MGVKKIEFNDGCESILENIYVAFIIFPSLKSFYRKISRYICFWIVADKRLYIKVDFEDITRCLMSVGF